MRLPGPPPDRSRHQALDREAGPTVDRDLLENVQVALRCGPVHENRLAAAQSPAGDGRLRGLHGELRLPGAEELQRVGEAEDLVPAPVSPEQDRDLVQADLEQAGDVPDDAGEGFLEGGGGGLSLVAPADRVELGL